MVAATQKVVSGTDGIGFLNLALGVGLSLAVFFNPMGGGQTAHGQNPSFQIASFQIATFDAQRTLGHEQCQKCHADQYSVLQQHPHFLSGRQFHRQPAAMEMAKALGHRRVKRTESCIRCHYTPQEADGKTKAVAGISCESCHGPSRDWLMVHNDYGGPTVTKQSESAAHKQQRVNDSLERGMSHPSHVYTLARSCYRCHLIDDETLVNVGNHPVRSPGFEFVAWSQGNMRHNFLRTGGSHNAPSDQNRIRLMYVVGQLTELEYSLRAAAIATSRESFAVEHAQNANRLRQVARTLAMKTGNAHVASVAGIALNAKLKLGNRDGLVAAADGISQQLWQLSQTEDGSNLESIDDMLPSQESYMGTPVRSR